ncbi:HpcH-HpaI domain-containing protein [Mycena chlorophos]|uniref:HpcH-HpaI domain-containing protein n=1 Tax=Mycena chlorophos TaxID=658473 RepID=A0A8H6S3P3_MYCCL|nr:HpcH-HpaI domain-containing protein [Mycena chlorophos]
MFLRRQPPSAILLRGLRSLTTSTAHNEATASLKRSHLYVPAASDRMLEKSLTTTSDVIVYDLEDSVPPAEADKAAARNRLAKFLQRDDLPPRERVAVRVNDISTPFFVDDIAAIASSKRVGSLVLPKVHAAEDLDVVSQALTAANRVVSNSLDLIASIESARASFNLGEIAGWKAKDTLGGTLTALLFAAEDYCADTSILRTPTRRELLQVYALFNRHCSQSVPVKRHRHGLCQLQGPGIFGGGMSRWATAGLHGKGHFTILFAFRVSQETAQQAIHPSQVDVIQSTFVPSSAEIERAAKIVAQMDREHAANRGATGLDGEMIDMPMILQARKILSIARAANLEIPEL